TLVMGLYANRPFAIAPYMGENAFVAFTVVKVLGYSWQTAMAAVFLAGVMFTLLTVARVRAWMVEALPSGLSYSFGVGIGLFLTFIGLNESGVVAIGAPGAPVRLGNLATPSVETAILSVVTTKRRSPFMKSTNSANWILVTGTSTGIGRAATFTLAENGYRVLAAVRKQ